MKIINTERLVIKSWCNNPEEGAIKQARNLTNLPFLFRQVCLMPDTHQGYGMPIGGVIASQGVVIPNAVGVDIGCGMLAVKTSLTEIDTPKLKAIMGRIRESVPVGFNHHKDPQADILDLYPEFIGNLPVINREAKNSLYQLGTLGGGNHFIEIQKGSDDHIWYMIHSGSRNLGKKVADYHNEVAVSLNSRWHSSIPKEWELAFLPIETDEAKTYLAEMNICLKFAFNNRCLMADRILDAFGAETDCKYLERHNIHHNYAAWEHHFGKNVLIHRKGATSAKEGEIGIIPGSQGTASYIVRGKGNPESFQSCSHGAGRRMGRKEAIRSLNLEEEKRRLDEKSIVHAVRNQQDLEEGAGAYKDIDVVMEEQKDLVEILVKLEPLGVIKG